MSSTSRASCPPRRAALVQQDGLGPRPAVPLQPAWNRGAPTRAVRPLIDAYHDGALALGGPFGVWGAVALDRADPDDVDRALDRGCIGLSLPAGALSSVGALSRLQALLGRLEQRGAPLFIHPGPGSAASS